MVMVYGGCSKKYLVVLKPSMNHHTFKRQIGLLSRFRSKKKMGKHAFSKRLH